MIRRPPAKDVSKVEFNCESVVDSFATKGYVVLNQFFSSKLTKLMTVECQALFSQHQSISHKYQGSTISSCILEPMNNTGRTNLQIYQTDTVNVNQQKYRKARISRSPVNSKDTSASEDILNRVVFSKALKTILQNILGDDVYLLNEQYIVKPPMHHSANETKYSQGGEKNTAFKWHRDYDSLKDVCKNSLYPYVSVWVALNDMTIRNGCLFILPKDVEEEFRSQNDSMNVYDVSLEALQGTKGANSRKYFVPLSLKEGDVCILSHDVWHCSPPNTTEAFRRAFMPQYSSAPIYYDDDIKVSDALLLRRKKRKRGDASALVTCNFTHGPADDAIKPEGKKKLVASAVKL